MKKNSFIFAEIKLKISLKIENLVFFLHLLAFIALTGWSHFCLSAKISNLTVDLAFNKVKLIIIEIAIDFLI